jgi:hypothetical protein
MHLQKALNIFLELIAKYFALLLCAKGHSVLLMHRPLCGKTMVT